VPVDLLRRTDRDLDDLRRRLTAWLRPEGVEVLAARHAAGAGTANETVLLDCRTPEGPRGMVVRLTVPGAEAYLEPDLARQGAALRWVAAHTDVPVPHVHGVEPTGEVLGAPFLLLERVDGVVPPDYPNYNAAGPLAELSAPDRRALWQNALDTVAALHRADTATVDFLEPGLAPLVQYWHRMADWVGERAPLGPLLAVRDWLEGHVPADAPAGLSWGDARLGNMMFAGTRCVAVLDWEMVSLGGPMVDLAWWLMFDRNHSTDAGVPRLPGLGTREETIDRWRGRTGLPVVDLRWHEVFALFQLALLRANAFADRARVGAPVPDDADPRSVRRLLDRIDEQLS
jgi:aminoglycoside phosphotransferase (APT) family kinase protein